MAHGCANSVLLVCCHYVPRFLLFTLPFLLASHPPLLTATVLACARTPTVLTLQLIVGTSWFSGRVELIAFHASPTLTRPGIPKPPRPGRVCVGAPTRRLPLGCIIASRAGCGRYTTPGCKPAPLTRSGVWLAPIKCSGISRHRARSGISRHCTRTGISRRCARSGISRR